LAIVAQAARDCHGRNPRIGPGGGGGGGFTRAAGAAGGGGGGGGPGAISRIIVPALALPDPSFGVHTSHRFGGGFGTAGLTGAGGSGGSSGSAASAVATPYGVLGPFIGGGRCSRWRGRNKRRLGWHVRHSAILRHPLRWRGRWRRHGHIERRQQRRQHYRCRYHSDPRGRHGQRNCTNSRRGRHLALEAHVRHGRRGRRRIGNGRRWRLRRARCLRLWRRRRRCWRHGRNRR
jgi:hypothetical protein